MSGVMALTSDEHSVTICDSSVAVTGKSGPVHATWTLLVDEQEADSAKAAGDFTLKGVLGDGSQVEAAVHQSLVGPTRVVITHEGVEVAQFKGFVA